MEKNTKLVLGIVGVGVLVLVILFVSLLSLLGSIGGLNGTGFGNTVAVIPVHGEIAYGESNILESSVVNPQTVIDNIEEAEKDGSISAIVLDVNSPGGSPVASEEIMHAVNNSKKPVVVWISDMGASGAYLVASPADKIVASPSSIVGSIGVILSLTDLSGLYQKIGVNQYAIKAGEYKDMGASYRNLTPKERAMLQEMVDQDYEYFIKLVAENRNLDVEYVRSIAEGKIYTGTQAKDLKLVDETGDREKAIEIAARLGGIKGDYNVMTLTPSESLSDILKGYSTNFAYALGKGIGSLINQDSVHNSVDYSLR
ncbi:MAG: protease [Methanobacterium sp.]|jgi:protease-4|uniref:signal peptide peptidase SppA n=1 Tax=Methanobacterium sp. TaxID=2164 RepID=UPI0003C9EA6E|nr:signal peptide peptidase SppA [Methanobacterium sp.]MDI3549467.1 protease [Methanobacterium sp.]CDG64836.1 signal peptide peptidase SppA, 36K type [Methanobacterium sp. MB1]